MYISITSNTETSENSSHDCYRQLNITKQMHIDRSSVLQNVNKCGHILYKYELCLEQVARRCTELPRLWRVFISYFQSVTAYLMYKVHVKQTGNVIGIVFCNRMWPIPVEHRQNTRCSSNKRSSYSSSKQAFAGLIQTHVFIALDVI